MGMMRMEEQKVQVTDTAPYNKEHKKGPRDVIVGKVYWEVVEVDKG
jgi:hypothetical protein